MWIRRLEVANLAGIESAALDFGPGLNVLHGPNELGKSTLVRAIRAALLLQDSSAAAADLIDWRVDAPPTVTLVFETEPQRIWRVKKTFGGGSPGSSYLEFSRDAQTFTQEARGREVDGKLQDLLRWGIEGPGGKGRRKRGVPKSFISTALLGEQSDVVAILNRSLANDPDDSGRERLTDALQAIAADPRFQAVLEAVQTKVDEAFTAAGQRKRGRDSPWVRLREELQAVRDRQAQVNQQLEESEKARQRIESLQQDLDSAREAAAAAAAVRQQVDTDLQRQQVRAEAEEAVAAAREEVARIQALHDTVSQTGVAVQQATERLGELNAAKATVDEQLQAASSGVEETRARIRELESGAAEQQRRIREQEIENQLLTLTGREKELLAKVRQAERIQTLASRLEELREEISGKERNVEEARSVLGDAQDAFTRDQEELERLNQQRRLIRYLTAKEARSEAESSLEAAQASKAEAERLQTRATEIRLEVERQQVPSAETISAVRSLETEYRVADEKLRVGISAAITPEGSIEVVAELDGVEQPSRSLAEREEFEAEGELKLRIDGVGEVDIRGGSRELQGAASAAGEQWEKVSRPIFEATGCASLTEVEALLQQSQEKLREAQQIETEAAAAAARGESSQALEQTQQEAAGDVARAESALRSILEDGTTFEALIDAVDDEDIPDEASIEDRTEDLEGSVGNRREIATQLEAQVSHDEGRLESLREELGEREEDLTEAQDGAHEDSQQVLATSRIELEDVKQNRSRSEQDLEATRREATTEVDEARTKFAELESELAEATTVAEAAGRECEEAQMTVARLEGELASQREVAEREGHAAALAREQERAGELDALPEPENEVKEDDLEQAERLEAQAKEAVRGAELQLRQGEGALEQVGGQYIQEQAEQARETIEAVAQREHEIEVDYGAWSLLRETLKEAESEDAVHLGNALVEPISERMSALTGARYGNVILGPELETSGIELGGAPRGQDSLSVGTQEQLATLLRLAIAEALETFLVLDDQLTQSDEQRMDWLRDALETASSNVQIVVFTCRPENYAGMAAASNERPEAAARSRLVDLTEVITRSSTAGIAAADPATEVRRKRPAAGAEQPDAFHPDTDATAGSSPETRTPTSTRQNRRKGKGRDDQKSKVSDLMVALKNSLKENK